MVHSCYGDSGCVTAAEGDENLVVAIFMNVGDENPYLASFWPNLAALASNSSATHVLDDMANPYDTLVPTASHDFYRYIGSTTTPSCVRNVEWFLMSTSVTLSQAQLTSYRTAISNHSYTQTVVAAAPTGVNAATWAAALGTNNRPVQTIGNRVPQKYTSPAEVAEQNTNFLWHGILILVVVVALALCCLAAYVKLSQPKDKKISRAVKPVKRAKPAEEIPLVAPPLQPAPVPQLFTQPLQVPMTYASPVQYQQPQMLQQQQMLMPQARPMMVAP